ncbi:MAG: endolytic transglycosylase MltG [Paramuribaculum sp.]|nr:endolytic transglycosylase MltG [Paramuribaculum sp.]
MESNNDNSVSTSTAPKKPQTRKTTTRKSSKKKSNSLVWTITIIAAVMLIGAFGVFCFHSYRGDEVWVYIPENATSDDIKKELTDKMGSGEATRVIGLWKLMGGDPAKAHGAYRFYPGAASIRIARRLQTGAQTPVSITFNNVRTLNDLAEKIAAPLEFSPNDFLEACSKELPGYGFDDKRTYIAAFLPDSYEAYWTDSAEKVVEKLVKHRNSFWDETRRQKAKALGITPVQTATIASIVEEESGKNDERPTIARLYLNRLHKGMKLQADPTVKFAVGDFSLRRILAKHLSVESPYNTYRNNGLPPGPIRLADARTIDAVLDAPKNNYIYMCAREDFSGYHNFAADYDTHLANAKRYQAELNKRGIK